MTTARMIGDPAYPKMIEGLDRELHNVIEDFDRAVYAKGLRLTELRVAALRLANETSKLSFLNPSMVDP